MRDNPADAEMVQAARRLINSAVSDPGERRVHRARGAAAVAIHHGASLEAAVRAGLDILTPSQQEA